MSRKDILEEASSEDIEYLQAIMNKKSISKEKNSFMKNTELAESKSWYRNENSFLQTNSEPNMISTRTTSVAETEKGITIDAKCSLSQNISIEQEELSTPEWFKKVAANFDLPHSEIDTNEITNIGKYAILRKS